MVALDDILKQIENMSDDLKLGLFTGAVLGITITFTLLLLTGAFRSGGSKRVNKTIDLDCPKVVNKVPVADIEDTGVYCRCWKSKTFPLCDGTHAKQ